MRRHTYPIAALIAALFACTTIGNADDANPWSFDLTPYLWLAGVEIDTSLPNAPTPPPAFSSGSGANRFDTSLSAGAMFALQARYRSVGLLVDFAWLRLDTQATAPGPAFSDINLRSDLIHSTAAATYSLPLTGRFHVDALAGARIWHVNEDLNFGSGRLPGFETSSDKTWADPIIGASVRYDLSRRFALVGTGTAGGFGVSADIAWEALAGVEYRFVQWCSATLAYRYLHEDYDRGDFRFELDAHGMLLGVGFHF